MTDKSFGDHMNRNIVKNPLLSSAVTGLSLDDLTYNAVLLPVSQAQELITRPDQSAQDRSLSNTDNAITNYPSGDTNANFYLPPHPVTLNPNPLDSPQKSDTQNLQHNRPPSTQSKASAKSTDDFDVNEYFARLQGTRYVSAPLNSQIKEDANANLQATDESLEEINLNDEKPEVETQSFTSDIAQNFSQLPTVLPQVASAVFSSFSNMLSMKSKDTTPEIAPQIPVSQEEYQIDQTDNAKENVQLMSVAQFGEVREVRMPPREPPVVGTSNYRLPTKKKYAQIPGLSTGDKVQIPSYNPLDHTNVPSYFVPKSQTQNDGSQNYGNVQASFADNTHSVALNQPYSVDEARTVTSQKDNQVKYNIFSPGSFIETPKGNTHTEANRTVYGVANTVVDKNQASIAQAKIPANENYGTNISFPQENIVQAKSTLQNYSLQDANKPNYSPQENVSLAIMPLGQENTAAVPNLGVIPPPPMFSNAPKRDSTPNSGVGRAILPPSVARRIGPNHPVLKPKTQAVPSVENIFVPDLNSERTEITNFQQQPSAFTPYTSKATHSTASNPKVSNVAEDNVSSIPPPSLSSNVLTPMHFGSNVMISPPPKSVTPIPITSNTQKLEAVAPPPMFSKNSGAPYLQSSSKDNSLFSSSDLQSSVPSNMIHSSQMFHHSSHLDRETVAPPPTYTPSSFPTSVQSMPAPTSQGSPITQPVGTNLPPPPSFFDPGNSKTETSYGPSIFTPPTMQQVNVLPGPPSLFNLGQGAAKLEDSSKPENRPPPPVFFNPNTMQVAATQIPKTDSVINQPSNSESELLKMAEPPKVAGIVNYTMADSISTSSSQPGSSEPPKMAEPPKVAGNLNYRMTKKRPQYYAGPISGVGDISNNLKPIIQPIETGVFQGALFIPTVQVQEEVVSQPILDLNQASVPFAQGVPIIEQYATGAANQNQPFDISRPVENVSRFTSIGLQENIPNTQDLNFNTVFDVSRPTTDTYEPPKEQKGFGIIGSLKSKLSSIDINKIQSTVTTFFDPSYNEGKNEIEASGENYSSMTNMPSFEHYAVHGHYDGPQSGGIEVVVPNIEQQLQQFVPNMDTQYQQSYDYQHQQHTPMQNQEQFQTQYLYSHYPNQGQNYPPFSYYSEEAKQFSSTINTMTLNNPNIPTSSGNQQITASQESVAESLESTNAACPASVQCVRHETIETKSHEVISQDNDAKLFFEIQPLPPQSNLIQSSTFGNPEQKLDPVITQPSSNIFSEIPSQTSLEIQSNSKQFQEDNSGSKLSEIGFVTPSNAHNAASAKNFFDIPSNKNLSSQGNISLMKETSAKTQKADLTSRRHVYLMGASEKTEEADISNQGHVYLMGASEKSEEFDPKHSSTSTYDHSSDYGLQKNFESYPVEAPKNQPYENFFGSFGNVDESSIPHENHDYTATNLAKMLENATKYEEKYTGNVTKCDESFTPIGGLSTMLANKCKELSDLQHDMENINIQDSRNIDTIFNRGSNVSFFDVSKPKVLNDSHESTELKISGTLREVNPINETFDLTKQLIDNITSPIQLSNPVEVPLTESVSDVRIPEEIDQNLLEEISHITEETIETIQVQSATELLDDNILNEGKYGWCSNKTNISEHTLQSPPKPIGFVPELGCTSRGPPKPIGFPSRSLFSDSNIPSIPRNASDALKAEFKCHEESPISAQHEEEKLILSRQMSIPTAPPIEDVEKSDETIDVHSIEQDASKDFPGEEPSDTKDFPGEEFIIEPSEFIIEPSETDDVKIEYRERGNSNAAETQDEIESFTSRVEKFKQLDQIVNDVIEKTSPILGLSSVTNPSLPIASYFDTGNYAADNYYKNLSSPNFGQFIMGSPPQMRVPPGFEEEYLKRLSGLKPHIQQNDPNKADPASLLAPPNPISKDPKPEIPETSTQTRPTNSPTFTSAQRKYEITTEGFTMPKMTDSVQESSPPADIENFPEFDLFGSKGHGKMILPLAAIVNPNIISEDMKRLDTKNTKRDLQNNPAVSNIFGAVKETNIPHRLDTFSELTKHTHIPEDDDLKPVIPDIFGVKEEALPKGHSETFSAFRQEPIKAKIKINKPEHSGKFAFGHEPMKQSREICNPEHLEIFTTFSQEPTEEATKVVKPNLATISDPNRVKLQDPMNFFSAETTVAKEDGTNRLASYFAAPAQAPSKSFFELSQGQDHYRLNPSLNIEIINKKPEDSQLASQKENYSQNTFNIPENQYLANINLIKELTSPQNSEIDTEKNVKIVNYFTVEYDSENPFIHESNIGEPEHHRKLNFKCDNKDYVIDQETDDKTLNTIISKCKYCCDFGHGHIETYFNVDHENINLFDLNNKGLKHMSSEKADVTLLDYKHKGRRCMNSENDKSDVKTDKVDKMDSKADKSQSVTLTFEEESVGNESNEGVASGTENRTSAEYTPVNHHWFYRVDVEGKSIWRGFSLADSQALEQAYHSPELSEETLVATDGGRFDVNIIGRLRIPVYWQDKPTNVRRCSWFYKGTTDARYVPYTEAVAEKLEEEYRHGMTTGEWHRRLVLPSNELVVMHTPKVMVHFLQSDDAFSSPMFAFGKRVYRAPLRIRVSRDQVEKVDHLVFMVHGAGEYRNQKEREKVQSTMRPRVVRRGHDESEIEDFEPSNIDHLLLLCHGVGSACDMRFRSVEEVVDDFRTTSLQLLQSHYKNSYESGAVGRVEVLPISWHATLHSGETGVDRRLARVTLDSIPRLRNFTNDTVLDVLFYTSPVFSQTIIDTVCSELNRIYKLFCSRNPNFSGGVSLGGHSLGSVILYDLLGNQINEKDTRPKTPKQFVPNLPGTGEHTVKYPKLDFNPTALYALGSPIAIFECIRGVEELGRDFKLPTCRHFFNIFHPYDPIAYRIEPLINGQLKNVKPQLIPHHKGRKRMHLELKDTMARVGADIKQKLVESIKSTWSNVWRSQPPPHRQLEKVVEEEIEREQLNQRSEKEEQNPVENDTQATPEMLGKLNNGRRVDYVLQEAPFEMINEYLFAMSSHVCYWESEDTMLMMLREIYDSLGVQPDSTVPQPNMTVQRVVDQTVVANMEVPSTSRGPT